MVPRDVLVAIDNGSRGQESFEATHRRFQDAYDNANEAKRQTEMSLMAELMAYKMGYAPKPRWFMGDPMDRFEDAMRKNPPGPGVR